MAEENAKSHRNELQIRSACTEHRNKVEAVTCGFQGQMQAVKCVVIMHLSDLRKD